jgi:ATP phosphoribosyltransferase
MLSMNSWHVWRPPVPIKLALPKGRLLRKTAAMLQKAGWGIDDYHSKTGFYRPRSQKFPELLLRVFHEKDIPIQIAMGNYDLGICCLDWIEELLVKYPSSDVVKVRDLGYGDGSLYAASTLSARELHRNGSPVCIASEYPNLAESFALRERLGRFSIFPVWGAAEVYPPENADIALLAARSPSDWNAYGIVSVARLLDFSAFLIASRQSWESKDLDSIVTSIVDTLGIIEKKSPSSDDICPTGIPGFARSAKTPKDVVRLALPDGHQQQFAAALLRDAGIKVDDYPSATGNRRPGISLSGVTVKVIRPQDMPQQVASGNFDLAITGRDWLTEHLAQFPASPVAELVDLKQGRVRLVAVVSAELAADGVDGLRRLVAVRETPLRVASEYVNIADKYARDNHLGRYRVIPTWGATEAFLPEDADLLIENTETGRTIARHNLKIIDTLFESTACLIGNKNNAPGPVKTDRMNDIIGRLWAAAGVLK